MAKIAQAVKRARLALDLPPDVRRRVRLAAARRDMTLQDYVRGALDRELARDAPEALSGTDDPVLADVWSNEADDVYDKA